MKVLQVSKAELSINNSAKIKRKNETKILGVI